MNVLITPTGKVKLITGGSKQPYGQGVIACYGTNFLL